MWLWLIVACSEGRPICPERMKWKEHVPLQGHRAGWCEGASGAKNGPYREWNPAGLRVVDGYYWRNQRSGWWSRWRDDGTLSEQTPYTAGKIHGPHRLYDDVGALVSERWHDHGEVHEGPLPSAFDGPPPK
jgi:antitoxin component YwqK of YwqJK toxin-antitoxin module